MTSFASSIRPFVDRELWLASSAGRCGDPALAFTHLERGHVLGQASTVQHVRVHWHMLMWGVRRADLRECLGQALRMIGAATKTVFGLVPTGNTGGSDVSPFRIMPVPAELAAIIERARASHR